MSAWVEVPFQAQLEQSGRRVDAFLAMRLKRYSRSQVQRLIEQGRVLLRGRAVKAATRVSSGETVVIRYPKTSEPPCAHSSLSVLHEDAALLAVDKPGGVLSHPTDKVLANSVTSILAAQFPGKKLHLAHRLDRETSGVLLLGRSPQAARALVSQFEGRLVSKEYLAVVRGRVPWASLRVESPLAGEGGEIKVRQAVGGREGSPASTEFFRLSSSHGASLVRALPKTGRLHQIRVHLASLGHPVLGDKLYTGRGEAYLKACRHELTDDDLLALGAPRQMLHALRVRFAHPADGRPMDIRAPIPSDMRACLARARLRLVP